MTRHIRLRRTDGNARFGALIAQCVAAPCPCRDFDLLASAIFAARALLTSPILSDQAARTETLLILGGEPDDVPAAPPTRCKGVAK